MTAQEQRMLQELADRINRTPLAEKDPDAERMIGETLGQNPDALYLMAQIVLVQEYALDEAQKQIAALRAASSHAQHSVEAPQQEYAGHGLAYPSGGYPIPNAPGPESRGFLRDAMQTGGRHEEHMRDASSGGNDANRSDDGTSADDVDGTRGSDYSAQGDDSMLSDDVGEA